MKSSYIIAVDLGGTKILAGLVDSSNTIISTLSVPTEIELGYEQAVNKIVDIAYTLTKDNAISLQNCCISICCPGPIDLEKGALVHSPNLGWGIVFLRNDLHKRLSIPVFIEHDAKASALGEFHYGLGKNENSMVYIVVGTGVGGAIIIDGKLYRGMHNFAGEFGHFTIDYDGSPGLSQVPGNVQSFMAGPSLVHRYTQMLLKERGKSSATHLSLTGKDISEKAMSNDAIAREVISSAGNALGITVATLAMILDIELFVIGSSVAKIGDMFLDAARKSVGTYSFQSVASFVRIEASSLGDDAPLLGCTILAKDNANI